LTARQPTLKKMFARVPSRYDVVNRVVTLGQDQRWRALAVRRCLEHQPRRVLDICTGTGDLALALAAAAPPEVRVTAADFSPPMLELAGHKATADGLARRPELVLADAAELPFVDGAFDAVGIGFGFRNLTYRNPHRERHLAEIARIVAPGGRFVIVESSQPEAALVRGGFHLFLRAWVGPLGGFISGERGPYSYLATSARRFYTVGEVEELLLAAGFARFESTPLLLGAAAVHVAHR
jgi:demethylmenaquinone methyltransferase/2-methoxy-6-polyprenyl-1,4-benzoquinol methylase